MSEIASVSDLIAALIVRFPRHEAEIKAWSEDYRRRFMTLKPAELRATLDHVLAYWTRSTPPKPAEIAVKRDDEPTHGRTMLTLTAEDLFHRPMGNGTTIPDLPDDLFREWQYQNGPLFLARLEVWKRRGASPELAQRLRDARTIEAIEALDCEDRNLRTDAAIRADAGRDAPVIATDAQTHLRAYDRWVAAGCLQGRFHRDETAPPDRARMDRDLEAFRQAFDPTPPKPSSEAEPPP
jgi:hypothetical protein